MAVVNALLWWFGKIIMATAEIDFDMIFRSAIFP